MPVEIREIVIKTTIQSRDTGSSSNLDDYNLGKIKREVLESCRKLLEENQKRVKYKR